MRFPIILILLCFFVSTTNISAQSPYEFNFKRESKFILSGLSGYGTAMILQQGTQSLNPAQLLDINEDRDDLLELDRIAIYQNSHHHDLMSDHLFMGSFFLPTLFLGPQKTRKEFKEIALLYSETVLLSGAITNFSKYAFRRPRPYVYNELLDPQYKLGKNARASFISGHTTLTATNTFFMAKVFSDFYPDSKMKPYVWTAAAIIPAAVGYFRVSSGNHFPTDVIAGYVVGGAIGILVPEFHKQKYLKKSNLNLDASLGGVSLKWEF